MVDIGISGASTKLGFAVLARLAERMEVGRVVVLRLCGEAYPLEVPKGVDLVDANTDRDDLTLALRGVGLIIDLAQGPCPGPVVPSCDSPSSARLSSLRKMLDAASRVEVSQFLHLSSSVVYGAWPSNPVPLPDDAPVKPDPAFAWALEHTEAERLLADWDDACPEAKVCVLRPALVLAPGDEGLTKAIGGVRSMRVHGNRRPVQFLHIDDLADAVVLAVTKELDGVFNVAPETWTDDELASELASGVRTPSLPGPVVSALRRVLWTVGLGAVPPWTQRYVSEPWVISSDHLRSLGWKPSYGSEEALVATTKPVPLAGLSPQRRQELLLGGLGVGAVGALAFLFFVLRYVFKLARGNAGS